MTPHTQRRSRISQLGRSAVGAIMGVVMALAVSGCAGMTLTGAGVGGALVDDQVNTGQAVKEQAQKAAGQVETGRVPSVAQSCPADAEALAKLMADTGGKSVLTEEERRAADSLFRAALDCGPEVSEPYLEWSGR